MRFSYPLKSFCVLSIVVFLCSCSIVKLSGKMPYYIGNYNSPTYKNKKKLFALTKLDESGLLDHLSSLPKADTVILFGSYSRSDWYKESDIDIFIHGDAQGLKVAEYELKLHRDIQLFICHDKKELTKLGSGLLKNIIKGNFIKGDLDFIEVSVHGQILNSIRSLFEM